MCVWERRKTKHNRVWVNEKNKYTLLFFLVVYFTVTQWVFLFWRVALTWASVALGGEGRSPCGEGVSCGRVHYTGVEGRVRIGPEGKETYGVWDVKREWERRRAFEEAADQVSPNTVEQERKTQPQPKEPSRAACQNNSTLKYFVSFHRRQQNI